MGGGGDVPNQLEKLLCRLTCDQIPKAVNIWVTFFSVCPTEVPVVPQLMAANGEAVELVVEMEMLDAFQRPRKLEKKAPGNACRVR